MSNRKAVETLGMPQGTASNRLRKMLLFRQLKKHNENTCVRCEKEIETVDELSVEHIKPWEGISSELFWDLNNVAFSHMRCNVPHRHPGNVQNFGGRNRFELTKNAPEGTAWCAGHQDYLALEAFHSNQRNTSGCASYCKECRKVRLN